MKVVLDTNVLVAAFIARGVCSDVFERVVNDHELMLSPFLLEEFEHVMKGKLRLDRNRVDRAVALLRRAGPVFEPAPLTAPVSRDPDDDQILALAVAAGAEVLVTGDDDLLVLETFEAVPILSPRRFLTHPKL